MPAAPAPQPLPLSHTRIEAWQSCPAYFKARYIDKVPERKNPPMMVGSLFHVWAEQYVKVLLKNKEKTNLSAGRAIFERLWETRQNADYGTLTEAHYDEVSSLVENFLDSHIFEPEQVGAAELSLAFDRDWKTTGWLDKNVFFRLKIDRVDLLHEGGRKVCTITDYKTSWAMDSDDEAPAQLRRYVLGVSKVMPADEYWVALDYPRQKHIHSVRVEVDAAEREQKRIEAVSKRVEAARLDGNFPATPGASCNWCPIFDRCPAKAEAQEFLGIQDQDQAVAALGRLILLERERKALQDALKAWTGPGGVVKSGGMQYGPNRRQETFYNVSEVDAWAARFTIARDGLLKVSNEDMKKVLARLEKSSRAGNESAKAALAALPTPEIHINTEYRMKKAQED